MKQIFILVFGPVAAAYVAAMVPFAAADGESASPIFGVTIPDGYRQWKLIAPPMKVTR
jgi:hypothetical protein